MSNMGDYLKKKLYFFQVNYSYGKTAHIPYTAGQLCAYAFAVSEQNACIMTKLLEDVVTRGTAKGAQLLGGRVAVAGKTGTAQVGGKADDNGLFVCCAPSSNPDIAVASVVEHAGGGSYASLAAARVLEAFYKE